MTKTYQVPLKYSQNFIKSSKLVATLVEQSGITSDDVVVEIGPGRGKITKVLAQKAKRVVAVEKDRRLYEQCVSALKDYQNVHVVADDFLNYKLPQFEYKVFSNIPFSITAEIVRKLCFAQNPPSECFLIVQKEAAEKFCGAGKETIFSLMLKPIFEPKIVYRFKNFDFEPVPAVDIVLLHLSKREKSLVPSDERYEEYVDFVTYGFSRWKPDVKSALRNLFSNMQLKILAQNLGFDLKAKPSDLSFELWRKLFENFQAIVPHHKRILIRGAATKLQSDQKEMRKIDFYRSTSQR